MGKQHHPSMPFFSTFHSLLLLLLLRSPLLLSALTQPNHYFINCGSPVNVSDVITGRVFVGDASHFPNLIFTKSAEAAGDSLSLNTTSDIYRSARIFRQPLSSYALDVSASPGNYILRLHFFAFDSKENLSSAVFDVSVPGNLVLLKDFQVSGGASPVVKEFWLNLSVSRFVVYFNPKASSFAFVNALEVFLVIPQGFIPDRAPSINVTGKGTNYDGILHEVLQVVYRVNVGGDDIVSENDSTLWRTWKNDSSYALAPNATTPKSKQSPPTYQSDDDKYLATDYVYQTAKIMTRSTTNISKPNATWRFDVSPKSRYIVRAHFCDIISTSPSDVHIFNLYVYGNFAEVINSFNKTLGITETETAFHFDCVVYSDDYGVLNISIGFRNDSLSTAAYLNGLEVLKMMGNWDYRYVNQPGHGRAKVLAGTIAGSVSFLVIVVVVIVLMLKYRKPKQTATLDWPTLSVFRSTEGGVSSSDSRLTDHTVQNLHLGLKLSLAEIHFATNHFDEKLLIGKGGFGNVYKGVLRDNTQVAVKRSKPGQGQGILEFQTEIIVLSKIQHRHLVSLIGYCDERSEMILVFDFMEKRALRDHLYGSDLPPLSWKQRLDICIGAARGLHYLHKGSVSAIIHRDVKSTNILLDSNFVAKVADFGLSKFGPPDHEGTHFSTNIKGTFGYLDPEYFKTEQLTEKSDVYSFGVVLLEVLCAKPALNPSLPRDQMNLAEWGMASFQNGTIEEMIDVSLAGQINQNSLRKFCETAEKCLRDDSDKRPNMGDVIWDLEYALQLQQTGIQKQTGMDSMTDGSSMLALSNMQRFPSFSMSFVGGDDSGTAEPRETESKQTDTDVFSQMSIKEAR
ncbi:hypothetical protein MLD38_029022 [Melastoma candidum]|uniref:Uncharacterized protein n=2 Tax=Melastoma candidum TaxID=119954 RepID=A0ACB9N566_9MYRT|nr:hypothetical protein MLD38_029022 [Melastoma candidum]